MYIKATELKPRSRAEWLAMDEQALENQFSIIENEYPLVADTEAGRTFSMVRRMRIEKLIGLPTSFRSGFAISTKNGKAANEMTEDEWEEFYFDLSAGLNREFPHLYETLFSKTREKRRN